MKKRNSYTVDTVFVLVLFVVFSITVLFVLMSGAGVYKDTQSVMQERYEERTALSYISAKINHFDSEDSIAITKKDGVQILALSQGDFVTYIYCKDGFIKEMLVDKDQPFDADDGLEIIEASSLEFERIDNLLKITCVGESGTKAFVNLHVESGIGGDTNE